VGPLLDVPAVVAAALDDAHLLVAVLADVRDEQRLARERHPPGVPESPRVLLVGPRFADERVVLWNRVRHPVARLVDVDAEDAAEQVRRHVLSVAAVVVLVPVRDVAEARVVRGTAVAHADVEVAVGAEEHAAGVVVRLGLGYLEQAPLGGRVDGQVLAGLELREDERVVVAVGRLAGPWRAVPHEDAAVGLEIRVQSESEQPRSS